MTEKQALDLERRHFQFLPKEIALNIPYIGEVMGYKSRDQISADR